MKFKLFSDQSLHGGHGEEVLQSSLSEKIHTRAEDKTCGRGDSIYGVQIAENQTSANRFFGSAASQFIRPRFDLFEIYPITANKRSDS
jgi:hypothetical protein